MRTGHKLREVTESLPEDHVAVLRNALFQLLLQVAATMLVFAQSGNFSLKVLEAGTSEAVDLKMK